MSDLLYFQKPFPEDSWISPALRLMVVCPLVQVSVAEVLGAVEAKGDEAEQATEQLERLLFILHTLVSHRDGAKITKPEDVCQVRGERYSVRCSYIQSHNSVSFFTVFIILFSAGGVAADSELVAVGLLFPSAPPDHLLSAPRGEHHLAQSAHPGDGPEGVCLCETLRVCRVSGH